MKTSFLLILSIVMLLLIKTEKSNAQITAISISSSFDAIMPSHCVAPVEDSFLAYGYLTGTVTPTDSVTVNVNFDDGFDTSVNALISGGMYYATIVHRINLPGTYSSFITVTATGGATATATTTAYTLSDSCSTLTGTVYLDLNGNCTRDTLEPGMSYMPVYLVTTATGDTTIATWTDMDGHYSINLFPGSYVVITNKESMGGNVAPICPASGADSFTTTGGTYTKNFAYQCATPASLDMSAHLYYENLNAGYNQAMAITAGDWYWFSHITCSALSATVTLTLDPRLAYLYSFPGAPMPAVSGNTLTWNISTSADLFGLMTEILVHVNDSLTLGDTLCSTLYVTTTALTDTDLSNNTVVACTPVGASYDPNDKSVSPQGTGPQGYITNNTPLSYLIHFQNTGTAPAKNITVIDTLDANLDIKTLHVNNSTARVNIYTSGNIVTLRFNDINLPDSATSSTGSTGAIEYAIMPKSNLAPGTQIQNRAGIYFDHNPAIMTNATLNTIEQATAGVQHLTGKTWGINVFPNPANGQVNIMSDNKTDFTASMIDIVGRTVETVRSANGALIMNTFSIPAGLYLIKANDIKGNETTTKVEVRH